MLLMGMIALLPAVLLMGGVAAYRVSRRLGVRLHRGPNHSPAGVRVPARAVFVHTGGVLAIRRRSSIAPELVIAADGIHYRAVGTGHWPFDTIDHVEARQRRGGWKLIFVGRKRNAVLIADIIGEHNVLATLCALPDALALTPQAALLRNGSSRGGKEDLSLYRGVMR